MNKLTSLGLAAAISAGACGGRSELYNPAHQEKTTTTSSETGGTGGSDTGGHGGTGGEGAGPAVGTILVQNNGSLDEIIGAEPNARTAEFELSADIIEDQSISAIRLKMETALCDSAAITGPEQLFVKGKTDPVATGTYDNGYLDFAFSPPYILLKGQTKIFYTGAKTANTNDACCHSTVDTYLENPSDLTAVGTVYGLPSTIDDQYSKTDSHSTVETWRGTAAIEWLDSQPSNIPVGTNNVECLDVKMWDCLPGYTIHWKAGLVVVNGNEAPDAKDLLKSGPQTTPNFTLFKVRQKNNNGTLGGTLVGPNELNTTGSDVSQEIILGGTISKGTDINASLVFDIQNNQALIGNQFYCSLNLTINPPGTEITSDIDTIVQ